MLVWTGFMFMGTLGVMVPFVSRVDVDFFQILEQHLRREDAPLAGRDHLVYRSYYVPAKGAIGGNCEFSCSLLRLGPIESWLTR